MTGSPNFASVEPAAARSRWSMTLQRLTETPARWHPYQTVYDHNQTSRMPRDSCFLNGGSGSCAARGLCC
jgi:hypothetical protein